MEHKMHNIETDNPEWPGGGKGIFTIRAYAKVNIFLKITGRRDGYHTLFSRFMRVESLYDTLHFVPQKCETFTIEGTPEIPRESNTIYKAYKTLNEVTGNPDILDFFYRHKVVVEKRIPSQAGLGGGSSDAGAFLRMVRKICDLKLSTEELAFIGSKIGADVPFFVYDCASANVSGFGEVVEPFDEKPLHFEIYTPPISCDTAAVYGTFRQNFSAGANLSGSQDWKRIESHALLADNPDPAFLNDLYPAALLTCPLLRDYAPDGWYFSGSGSSFFSPSAAC
jgi:4-diphosphocytidyl-2-C-methyl-D-erythritol kinase